VIKSITIENKSMVSLHGLGAGEKTDIQVDEEGTPLDQHWRRRFADSAIDGCIAVVQAEQPKAKAPNKEAE
jgi:hypothetical protein